ncbi:PREDICTED: peroxidase 7 [Camelina sativa]|uniref:Peroxidase n=1 Tax=Camelina sativa TaxID=90675 RepID=A0ABM0VTK0_CAMSA|nr:PREDICTED: peroxidase 7 [Camelina sativa]
MKLAVVSAVVLLVVLVAWPVSAGRKDLPGAGGYGGDDDGDDDTQSWFPLDNQLSLNYYDKICPNFEKIVDNKVREWTKSDASLGPALLRLIFHDCGVTGCDASVLLDYEGTERRSPASKTLRGFELIDDIKSELEKSCPGLASCADILTAASRAATVQLGGPYWPNAYGRRDSKASYARDVEKVPSGRRDVTALLETFQSYGLNILDLVVLSGAHTIGQAYCGTIQSRLYNYNGTSGTDPSIEPKYADYLRRKCRWATETVSLDAITPAVFDNQYYINLQKNMGVLTTDQELVKDPRTAPLVKAFAEQPPQMFRQQFAVSMAKLVNVGVLTGEDRTGEIRKVCSKSNSGAAY